LSLELVEFVSGGYELYAKGFLPTFADRLDPHIEWNVPDVLPWGGTYHGPKEIGEFAETLREHVDQPNFLPDEIVDGGNRIVVLGLFSGRARASGRAFEARFAHVWHVRDGKLSKLDNYLDTATVLDAVRAGKAAASSSAGEARPPGKAGLEPA
jgi:uncharacterized protein